ncbi:MAG TPA: alpha/beta hydrolase [Steroidobacteraceae bacterium]|jgi:pimeloyl-ACP methyl ester carboxylesterase|nr:alpha/beta hydrolase [Steroidobacteraceae bacterium]HEV3285795.1 alpha/beta hydrolase [Steroidobacteraceae bacterium]
MIDGRTAALGLWLAALTACGQQPPPAGAGAAASAPGNAPASASAAASAAVPDPGGGPRVTLSPDNVHIEYHVYGHGDPAVVLVHGWACDANYWNGQIDALKERYTVVALNLAGHGASGSNRSDWSIANYAQDVAAVAHEIPNPRLVLVGHSMGAAVVLTATRLLGSRVIGVIAVEALRSVGRPALRAPDIERRLAPFNADFIGATRKLVSESLFPRDASAALVQKVAYDMSLEPPAVAIASMRSLLSLDLAAVLPTVHVPVYAINSDLAPTDAARIRRSLPDFTLDVLDHSSHFLMLEAPARFNPLLLKDVAAIAQRTPH